MSWSDCGTDSKGRPIGYGFEARCDEPGCRVKIDRGLSYACGGMHGEGQPGCEGYFCAIHLFHPAISTAFQSRLHIEGMQGPMCRECCAYYERYAIEQHACPKCGGDRDLASSNPFDNGAEVFICSECDEVEVAR